MSTNKKSAGADLADLNFADAESADMTVRHPVTDKPLRDEEGNPWTITLESAYSKTYERALHKAQNRRLQRRRQKISVEDMEAGTLECLVAVTRRWSGITMNGEKLECSAANAYKIYEHFPFIREQAIQFIEDHANFLPESKTG